MAFKFGDLLLTTMIFKEIFCKKNKFLVLKGLCCNVLTDIIV